MADRPARFPIVGIGASAGGVEALEGLFRGMPSTTGCGFVVITHLSPDRRSLLPEIVARYTHMPVHVAEDDAEVRPNEIHVLPADAVLDIEAGRLRMRKPTSSRSDRKPIDVFFSALATDQCEYAAGIVLSGGDGDGTLGVKAIKEQGGLTLAQVPDGDGPQYPEMPESAIATGMVDIAAPVHDMGTHLAEFARSFQLFDQMVAAERMADSDRPVTDARQEICAILRNQLGHDFSGYKQKTFLRRVQRRMQAARLQSLEGYVERLRQDPKEVSALFRDLLINVTNFFRDAEAFKVLEEKVIPKLFEGRGVEDAVRVWVPGCATGEEVFSIGMLLCEHMATLAPPPRVQIFATDIDERALSVARAGRYPESLLESVSEARRKRFFTYDDGSYVLIKEVRDLCVFSPHSVIRDPPFSRMDLISCRNLLIYLGGEAQSQVIPTFHYALRPGGYLFLGTSENVSHFGDMFTPVDKKQRVFRTRDDTTSPAALPLVVSGVRPAMFTPVRRGAGQSGVGAIALRQQVESQVLERFAPAHVVVSTEGEVVYYSARTGKYLEPSAGAPTRQLLTMARKGLRLDLRTALREAIESDRGVERREVVVENDDERIQRVDLTVEPLGEAVGDERLFLVVFEDVGPLLSRKDVEIAAGLEEESAAHLEGELRDTRERLQSLIEEYETALEELKSSNEELVSVNEELQSTNEELEASKEELQSLNEELHTVNAELTGKVDQLDRANNDLTNLFETTRVATLFLDRDLVIRSFTPAVTQIFNLLPTDRGRPLTDLVGRVSLPTLIEDVGEVFRTGATLERTIGGTPGATFFLLRLSPYRGNDARVDGVVLTFVDVTTFTDAEAHQKVLVAKLNQRVRTMLSVVLNFAEQSYRTTDDRESFKEKFVERVKGMARSYELLASENWTELLLADLLRPHLATFGAERVKLEGPPLKLSPKQALSIGMIMHELTMNAARYGALSDADGRVDVRWNEKANGAGAEVVIEWRESRGRLPAQEGDGLDLIAREAQFGLDGVADFKFDPSGFFVSLTFAKADDERDA